MGYIAQWDEFSVAAERLYLASPLRVSIFNVIINSTSIFILKMATYKLIVVPD